MQSKNKIITNCIKSYPKCIEWDLPPIPCLGIKTGDTLDEITFAIVRKICEISGEDLSTLNIQCLIDKLGAVEPLNKTLHNYLKLIIDNECKLADLIVAINNRIDGLVTPTLILDLKCLATYDSFGNQLPYNEKTVLQALITEACLIRNQIAGLTGAISLVNIRIDNLPAPYTEPSLTSCLYTAQPTSSALTILASDYCVYKAILGTVPNIQTAIGRQCTGLNTQFATNLNFIQNPASQAHTINNLWITVCDLRARLTTLEGCACKITCKDVMIGFIVVFNEDRTVNLKFTKGAGTNLPTGFADCGTMLTIKNEKGIFSGPTPITITQDGEIDGIDVSMFEQGDLLTFSLEVNMCSTGLNCQKCITKTVKNLSGCCLITNSGTGTISITYKTCGITPST